ncbi:MAG: NBR1-Ig-like domain-containing protein [Fimbriimonadaceae bacterium]|nr:NBR1-Ig-like domain-containing protein [Fimbriimonadaceae bacterium]
MSGWGRFRHFWSLAILLLLTWVASAQSTPTAQSAPNIFAESVGFPATTNARAELSITLGPTPLRARTSLVGMGNVTQFLDAPRPEVNPSRHTFTRPDVTEWFDAKPGRVHHWLRVERRLPTADGTLWVRVQLQGAHRVRNLNDTAIEIHADGGSLIYSGLKVWDARKRELAARLVARDGAFDIQVDAHHAVYPVTIDPEWTRAQQLPLPAGPYLQPEPEWRDSGTVGVLRGFERNPQAIEAAYYVRKDGVWTLHSTFKPKKPTNRFETHFDGQRIITYEDEGNRKLFTVYRAEVTGPRKLFTFSPPDSYGRMSEISFKRNVLVISFFARPSHSGTNGNSRLFTYDLSDTGITNERAVPLPNDQVYVFPVSAIATNGNQIFLSSTFEGFLGPDFGMISVLRAYRSVDGEWKPVSAFVTTYTDRIFGAESHGIVYDAFSYAHFAPFYTSLNDGKFGTSRWIAGSNNDYNYTSYFASFLTCTYGYQDSRYSTIDYLPPSPDSPPVILQGDHLLPDGKPFRHHVGANDRELFAYTTNQSIWVTPYQITPRLSVTPATPEPRQESTVDLTVSVGLPRSVDSLVTLTTNRNFLSLPASVTVPKGQVNVTVPVRVAEGARLGPVTIEASTPGLAPVRTTLNVQPTATPRQLALRNVRTAVRRSEPVQFIADIGYASNRPIVVRLAGNAERLQLPATVTIPAGERQVTFTANSHATAPVGPTAIEGRTDAYGSARTSIAITDEEHDGQFVSQQVPTPMIGGYTYSVAVEMRNIGAADWTDRNVELVSINPSTGHAWTDAPVRLPAGTRVVHGERFRFEFPVVADPQPGVRNFQWQIRLVNPPPAGLIGTPSPPTPINVRFTRDARFLSQTVPLQLEPGEIASARLEFRNLGSETWSPDFRLTSRNLPADQFRTDAVAAPATGPNQIAIFTLNFVAPIAEGTYPFQWQMRRLGEDFFGEPNAPLSVTVRQTLRAEAVSQSVPSRLPPGQRHEVTLTFRNTGTVRWTPETVELVADTAPLDRWSAPKVRLPRAVEVGESIALRFAIVAPSTPGNYNFSYRLRRRTPTLHPFPAASPVRTIRVAP